MVNEWKMKDRETEQLKREIRLLQRQIVELKRENKQLESEKKRLVADWNKERDTFNAQIKRFKEDRQFNAGLDLS